MKMYDPTPNNVLNTGWCCTWLSPVFLFVTSWTHVYVCFHQVATMSSSNFYVSHHEPIILLLFIRLLLNSFPSQDKLQMILALNPTLDETSLKNLSSKNTQHREAAALQCWCDEGDPFARTAPEEQALALAVLDGGLQPQRQRARGHQGQSRQHSELDLRCRLLQAEARQLGLSTTRPSTLRRSRSRSCR